MAINWHGVQRPSIPGDPDSPKLWYPQWVPGPTRDTAKRAKRMSEMTKYSETDVTAMFSATGIDTVESLLEGEPNKFDGLFTIMLSVTTPGPGAATEADLNKLKKQVDAYIRLAPEIRDALDRAKFQKEG